MIWVISGAALILCAVFCILFLRGGQKKSVHALIKCVPGFSCFLLALAGMFLRSGFTGARAVLCIGLLICTAADWMLEYSFVPGTSLFMLAHLCFICAFISIGGFVPVVWAFVALSVVLYVLFLRFRRKGASPSPALLPAAYILLISLMAAFAFNCGALFAIGALLFVFSDALLGARIYAQISFRYSGTAVMVLYYAALYLLALGCVFQV